MRPRINKFGKITLSEINKYFLENQVYPSTGKREGDTILYNYLIMFRHNIKKPEIVSIKVSSVSKLILKAETNKGIIFNNIDELKSYTKNNK